MLWGALSDTGDGFIHIFAGFSLNVEATDINPGTYSIYSNTKKYPLHNSTPTVLNAKCLTIRNVSLLLHFHSMPELFLCLLV